MILNDVLDRINKKERKHMRIKSVKKWTAVIVTIAVASTVIGIIFDLKRTKEERELKKVMNTNTTKTISAAVLKKVDTAKDSAAHAQEVSSAVKDIHGKTKSVKKVIKRSGHKIEKEIHKTAEDISDKNSNKL